MRITLKTLAVAAVVAMPVGFAALGALVVGTTAAHAQKAQFERAKPHLAPHRKARIDKLALRRCLISRRLMVYREVRRLRHAGYRKLRVTRYYQFRPRCWQSIRVTACRGIRKFHFEIRYRFGKRIRTFRTYRGRCHGHRRLPLKRAS